LSVSIDSIISAQIEANDELGTIKSNIDTTVVHTLVTGNKLRIEKNKIIASDPLEGSTYVGDIVIRSESFDGRSTSYY
jgi:hypothetical protein